LETKPISLSTPTHEKRMNSQRGTRATTIFSFKMVQELANWIGILRIIKRKVKRGKKWKKCSRINIHTFFFPKNTKQPCTMNKNYALSVAKKEKESEQKKNNQKLRCPRMCGVDLIPYVFSPLPLPLPLPLPVALHSSPCSFEKKNTKREKKGDIYKKRP
jgi:hypothetical protein